MEAPSVPGARMVSRVPVVLLSCGSFNPITNMHLRMFELARDHLQATGLYQVVQGLLSPVGDEYGKPGLMPAVHRLAMAEKAVETSGWINADAWESQQGCWLETIKTLRHHHNRILEEWTLLGNTVSSGVTTASERGLVNGPLPRGSKRKLKKYGVARVVKRPKIGTPSGVPCDGGEGSPAGTAAGQLRLMLLCGADMLHSFHVPGLWKTADVEEIIGRFGLVCVSRSGYDCPKIIYESELLWKLRASIHLVQEWVTTELSSTHVRRAVRRGASVRYLVPDAVAEYIARHGLYRIDEEEGKDRFALLAPLARQRDDAAAADITNDNTTSRATNHTGKKAAVTVTTAATTTTTTLQ